MRSLISFPLLVIIVAVYNALVFGAATNFDETAFSWDMMSGAFVNVTIGDTIILGGLFLLFCEIIKAVRVGNSTIADHMLSTAVFIGALIEFLLVKSAGTSVFLVIVFLCFIDVVAGYTISIRSARRDVSFGGGAGPF